MTQNPDDSAPPGAILGGRLLLRQSARGHRAGTDAVLLAAAAGTPTGLLVDLGAGVGTAGLAVAARVPELRVRLIEIDGPTAALARENAALNGLTARVEVTEADALSGSARRDAGLDQLAADLLITNPPWYAPGRARISPDADRARAHVARATTGDPGGLNRWMRAAAALLRAGGRMVMIHHAVELPAILEAVQGRFGGLSVLPIHPKAEREAIRVLIGGTRGSRAPLRLLPSLVLHESDGRFTPQAEALHRGEALLDLF